MKNILIFTFSTLSSLFNHFNIFLSVQQPSQAEASYCQEREGAPRHHHHHYRRRHHQHNHICNHHHHRHISPISNIIVMITGDCWE